MAEVTLHFHDLKDAKRLHRSLMKGKGMVLSNKHIGGFSFGNIGNMVKDAGKQLIKSDMAKNLAKKAISTVVNKGAEFIDSKTGNTGFAQSLADPLSNMATQQVQAQMDKAGQGMKKGRGRPKKAGAGAKKGGATKSAPKKSLKIPKDLEIYNSIYHGGSFKVLGGSMVPL